jgi:lipoprotein-anchoring transpeptidase ErfK/SrfK
VLHLQIRSRRRKLIPVAVACAAGLLLTACHSGSGGSASGSNGHRGGSSTPSPTSVQLTITPGNGSTGADPATGITVTAAHGTISSVKVSGAGLTGQRAVTGTLNSAKTSWHSTWTLPVDQKLTVTATGTGSGHTVTQTSTFTTKHPARTVTTQIFEGYNKQYGVGMPILLTFSQPVRNRAAVEKALSITTSKPVVGAWYWDGSEAVSFRPRDYWPAHTRVSFVAHLNGVQVAPGVYGDHTLTQQFNIGRSLIVVASTAKHHMKLYRDGKLIRRWPISTGKPGDWTPNGTYLTIEKANPVLMKGPGYSIEVPWSVRFTWSGDYLHDAYWSTSEQGFTNVSHGCVNMAPADAKYYYKMAVPGDPVTIAGSPRAGTWGNGWTQWFLSWPQLVRGSALHQAVQAGPGGSTFVSPSSLTASTAKSPLGTAQPGNSRAS